MEGWFFFLWRNQTLETCNNISTNYLHFYLWSNYNVASRL